jgi:hypothetical protein
MRAVSVEVPIVSRSGFAGVRGMRFVTEQKFPTGVMVFGSIGVRFKSTLIRCSKGGDEYEGMELSCGLLRRSPPVMERANGLFSKAEHGVTGGEDDVEAARVVSMLAKAPDLNQVIGLT